MRILALVTSLLLVTFSLSAFAQETSKQGTKLYRLDCGNIHVSDLNVFSDTEAYTGQEKNLVVSCYLINHAGKWLLWDTGLSSDLKNTPEGLVNGPFTLRLKKTLVEQLKELELVPDSIDYVGLSHTHFDHAANANLFKKATLLIQEKELQWILENPESAKDNHMSESNFDYFLKENRKDQLRKLKGDADIFGDGVVKAISLPGHTAGHMALQVKLQRSGTVILSGDQWHFKENFENNGVPTFNLNRTDTLASSDRLKNLVKNTNAKLIIQHDWKDNASLPKLPEFLD